MKEYGVSKEQAVEMIKSQIVDAGIAELIANGFVKQEALWKKTSG